MTALNSEYNVLCLKSVGRSITPQRPALTEKDDAYRLFRDTGLKNYLTFESKKNLLEALATADLLWVIYDALAQYRLRLACDEVRFLSFQRHGKLSSRLNEFLAECIADDQ